jgi:two-component system response regulator YesN
MTHFVDAPRAEQPGSDGSQPPIAKHPGYVLVVDDEAVVREFLTRCLERGGYVVKQAESAPEALQTMMSEPASVVLCDIRMPGQDGLWLASRLRARWPEIPVVMASAIDDLQTVRHSRDLGVVDYLTKPIKPEQLLEVVRRVTAAASQKEAMTEDVPAPSPEVPPSGETRIDAEYTLEAPVRCPACGERIATLKAVRLIRAQVNFTSTLPRRGRVIACPVCLAIVPAELTNF